MHFAWLLWLTAAGVAYSDEPVVPRAAGEIKGIKCGYTREGTRCSAMIERYEGLESCTNDGRTSQGAKVNNIYVGFDPTKSPGTMWMQQLLQAFNTGAQVSIKVTETCSHPTKEMKRPYTATEVMILQHAP